jgi:hypothetical protein
MINSEKPNVKFDDMAGKRTLRVRGKKTGNH